MKLKLLTLPLVVLSGSAAMIPAASYGGAAQAAQADQFVDSIGIAVHVNYPPETTGWSTLEPLLTGLGVRHIRDGVLQDDTYDPRYVDLAVNYGIKTTLVVDERTAKEPAPLKPSAIAGDITYLKTATYNGTPLLSAIEAIEGPNEYDLNSGGTNWEPALLSYQQMLHDDLRADSTFNAIPLLAPAMGQPKDQLTLSTSFSAIVDLGNNHPYPGTGIPSVSNLETFLCDSQTTWPALPLEISEDGYSTKANDPSEAVTEAVQGKWEPRILLENFRRGVQRTFLYELVDEDAPTGTAAYQYHFGLVRDDGTFSTKPAYTNIKNLISILKDPGASFTPGVLSYNLSGTTTGVHSLLLEKRNGFYYLVLWVEASTAVSQPVTLTFDDTVGSSATLYQPDSSTTGTNAAVSGNALALTLTDEPLIVAVRPSYPNGSLVVADFNDLSGTSASLDWQAVAATPTNWLGYTGEAERTAANGSNYLTFASVDIRGFSALLGFGWNTTDWTGVSYDFSKVEAFASPDNATWSSVPLYTGEIDKTTPLEAQASALWFATVSPSGPLPTGTNYVKLVVNSTDNVTLPGVFEMSVRQSGVIEAEAMTQTYAGPAPTVVTDPNASGGKYVLLSATAVGNYVQFTTPSLPAGTYSFWYRYVRGTNYGITQPSIDGSNIGGATGQNGTAGQYAETNRGKVTFSTAGAHTVRFTVTGTATSGYAVDVDRIVFQAE